jgi:transcriptional regulator with XRE-family HTH domain
MKDRIIKFLAHENLTATKFADEIGVQRSSVSHILSGRNNPSFEFIQKILSRYKNMSAEWLLQGTGTMFKKAEQGSLFTSPVHMPPQPSLFQQPSEKIKISSPEADKNLQPLPLPEILPSRKIDKILVFYTDKTFEEYKPQNNT